MATLNEEPKNEFDVLQERLDEAYTSLTRKSPSPIAATEKVASVDED